MIKNVIFDFGGVLVDWNPKYVFREVFDTGQEMDYFLENICTMEWNIEQDRGRTIAEATRIKIEEYPDKENLIRMYYDKWVDMLGGAIQKNVDLLLPLKERFNLYGLTNWSAETFPIALDMFPFFSEFDGKIVVSGEEKLIKPDPRIFELILDRYHLEAAESIFIDDNPDNIQTANRLGFKTIHCLGDTDVNAEIAQLSTENI